MASPDRRRVILANLDCEEHWAGSESARLSPRARATARFFAQQLRVFGDDATELAHSTEDGDFSSCAVLAWGETSAVHDLRRGPAVDRPDLPWEERLWHLYPAPTVAAQVNHRAFADSLAETQGWRLPGKTEVATLGQCQDVLLRMRHSRREAWAVKAPYAAAGRHTVFGLGRHLDAPTSRHLERLFARFGTLSIMPWYERAADLSVCGIVGERQSFLLPLHLNTCDARGVFRGVQTERDSVNSTVSEEHQPTMRRAGEVAADALSEAGYLGTFSVDGFTYGSGSDLALYPMSEINARLTFGLVAHAAALSR